MSVSPDPVPEVIDNVPLPSAVEEDMEYAASKAAPETGPLGEPISSVPVRLPFGLAPSALNSRSRCGALTDGGTDVKLLFSRQNGSSSSGL